MQWKIDKEALKVDFQACTLDLSFVYILLLGLKEFSQPHLFVPEAREKKQQLQIRVEITKV